MTEQPRSYPEAFEAFGLSKPLLKALTRMGWTEPSEIQSELIPLALQGRDVLGQARTGTGKTGAFALPILQLLVPAERVRCLALTPTRELAIQVAEEICQLGQFTPHKVIAAYGGTQLRQQAVELKSHPAIVVGTPGRVMDLMSRKLLRIEQLDFAVLDEVDRMLDIGFRDDIRKILGRVTTPHQTMFVSATIDSEINRLARKYMNNPVEIMLAPDRPTVEQVTQAYISVNPWDKRRMMAHVIQQTDPGLAIVFTRTKRETERLAKYLSDKGINAKEIHGDLYQKKRDSIMHGFRKGRITVLVATDLASRGLDIDDITHIFNFDIPEDPEGYIHRIGRTARMGHTGLAVTLVTPEQGSLLTEIEKLINKEISPMEVKDFKPSAPPESHHVAEAPPKPRPMSRLQAPIFAEDDDEKAPVRRTLGSKFPPRRKRRL